MTDRTEAGAHIGALVHERTGGPTMFVAALIDGPEGTFAFTKWKDETAEECCGTFRAEDLVVIVPYTAGGNR